MFRRSAVLGCALAALAIVIAGGARVVEALHRNTDTFVQITTEPSTALSAPSFAGKSSVLVFSSDGDLLQNGNAHSQIFVFDLKRRAKNGELALTQLTSGTVNSFAPSAARRVRTVAFHADGDLLGNGSTGRQVYAADKVKLKKGIVPTRQVTVPPGESFDAVLSGAGKFLAFTSTADLLAQGLGAGDHLYRTEIRKFLRSECPGYPCLAEGNPTLELITPFAAANPRMDRKGQRVVFESSGDVAGTGCVNGSTQLFMRDFKKEVVHQLTCGVGDSRNPAFSLDNKTILFESDADLLSTGSTRTQIFQLEVRSEPFVLSQRTAGTDGDSTNPAPNGTRTKDRYFFVSTANLTGSVVPGTPRLYQFDAAKGTVLLTDDETILSEIAGQFTFVTFVSDSDLVGNGNTQPQLFLINSFPFLE